MPRFHRTPSCRPLTRRSGTVRICVLATIALPAATAAAQDAPDQKNAPKSASITAHPELQFEDVTVHDKHREYVSAAQSDVPNADFATRPAKDRPGDLLRMVPDLVVAQHQGLGDAELIYFRGFDADHGSDIAMFQDDIPLNQRTHAHGQGFSSPQVLIPETIERIEFTKGPYDISIGDFANAGSIRFVTKKNFEESSISGTWGQWGTRRFFAGVGKELGQFDVAGAFEYYYTDTPYDRSEQYHRFNGFFKTTAAITDTSKLSLLFTGLQSDWHAPTHSPERALNEGLLDNGWGSFDPNIGGQHQQYQTEIAFVSETPTDKLKIDAYYAYSDFRLVSNETFFLNDPVHGDEFDQQDRRGKFGADASYSTVVARLYDNDVRVSGGIEERTDLAHLHNGLDQFGDVTHTLGLYHIQETSISPYVQVESPIAEKARIVLGTRYDTYNYALEDRGSDPASPNPDGSTTDNRIHGHKWAGVPGATAALILGPFDKTEVYFNFGMGHHSNDARAVFAQTDEKTATLPQEYAYEIGTRSRIFDDHLDIRAGAFIYDLQSELAIDQGSDTVVPAPRSRRVGLEFAARLHPTWWLLLGGDISYTDSEYIQDAPDFSIVKGNAVANAPQMLARGEITAHTDFGLSGTLEMRYVGWRWGVEDRSAKTEPYCVFDLMAKYRLPKEPGAPWSLSTALEGFIGIQNILDTKYAEASFYYTSRLPGEPAGGVLDRHFLRGMPFTLTGGVTLYF